MTRLGKIFYIFNKSVLVFLILLCNVILVYASSDDLAPRTSFGDNRGKIYQEAQRLLPGPHPQALKSRNTISIDILKQRILFVAHIVEKKDVQTHLKMYLSLLNQAGLISNQALNQSWNNKKAKLLIQLIRKMTNVVEFKDILTMEDPEFKSGLEILGLRLDEVEGHPLLMIADESFSYWTQRLNIDQLLPPLALRQRAIAERDDSEREKMNRSTLTISPLVVDYQNQASSQAGTELILVKDGAAGALAVRSESGLFGIKSAKKSNLNASFFVMRLLELALLADDESLGQAVELIQYTQFDQSLFRLFLSEDLIQFYDVTKSIFEKMDDRDAAGLFLEIARSEASAQDYEDVIAWLSNTLSSMDDEIAANILRNLIFNAELTSSFSRMLVDQILQYGFLNNQIYQAWHILAAEYPSQIWDWDVFYKSDSSLTSIYKKANGIGDVFRSLRQRLQNDRIFKRVSYKSLEERLREQLQTTQDMDSEQKIKKLQNISDLVLLGQNGFVAYDLILKNQLAFLDQLPYLFAAQDPEVLAVFLIEVGIVLSSDSEEDQKYAWLLSLLDPNVLGDDYINKVLIYMLFNEKYRSLGSHQILQKIVTLGSHPVYLEFGLKKIDLMGRVYKLVEIVLHSAENTGIYNSYEVIQSSGIFLVKDLQGALRENAVQNIFKSLEAKLNSPLIKADLFADELGEEYRASDQEEINNLVRIINTIGELQFGSHPDDFRDFPNKSVSRITRNYYDGSYTSAQILRGEGFQGAGVSGVPIEELKKNQRKTVEFLIQYAYGDYAVSVKEAALNTLQKIDPEIIEFFLNMIFEKASKRDDASSGVSGFSRIKLMEVYERLANHLFYSMRLDQADFYKERAKEFLKKCGYRTNADHSKILVDLLDSANRRGLWCYKTVILCLMLSEYYVGDKGGISYALLSHSLARFLEASMTMDEHSGEKRLFDLFALSIQIDKQSYRSSASNSGSKLSEVCFRINSLVELTHTANLLDPVIALLKIHGTLSCLEVLERLLKIETDENKLKILLKHMLKTSQSKNGILWVNIFCDQLEKLKNCGIPLGEILEYVSQMSDTIEADPELLKLFVEETVNLLISLADPQNQDYVEQVYFKDYDMKDKEKVLQSIVEKLFLSFLNRFSFKSESYANSLAALHVLINKGRIVYHPSNWPIMIDFFDSVQTDQIKFRSFIEALPYATKHLEQLSGDELKTRLAAIFVNPDIILRIQTDHELGDTKMLLFAA